jgi:hypothetical protein
MENIEIKLREMYNNNKLTLTNLNNFMKLADSTENNLKLTAQKALNDINEMNIKLEESLHNLYIISRNLL